MKTTNLRRISALILAATVLATGCASMSVTSDAIEKNTSTALGIEKGTFTISNREDDGVKSSYIVNTNAGHKYSCYVTGSVSVVGRTVSDAICTPMQKADAQAPKAPAPTCNALLKAAGKC